jgi:hypothetical protein
MPTRKMTELSVRVQARPGELTRILQAASRNGVNVIAFCGYNAGAEEAHIMFVPDKEERALKALKAIGLEPTVTPIIAVTGEAGPGAGAALCARLSDAGINIEYAYASTPGSGASTAIFKVPDADKALRILKGR